MDYQINFPHLGIYLEHVGKNITIGSYSIAFYGMIIGLGMLLGISAILKRASATGQSEDDYLTLAMAAVAAGIVGARIYYVIFSWDYYRENLLRILNIHEGGLAIYGAIIGGVLCLVIFARKKKMSIARVLDTCILGLPIGQILGRWGNFFNREAFGRYTDSLFAMQLPVSAVRQNEITAQMWEHMEQIGGVDFIQVTPTFLYESLWNAGVLLLLFLMRNRVRFQGQLFLTYVVGYGVGRFWIESLRTDQLLLPGSQIPVSMALSAAAAAAAAVLILVGIRRSSVSAGQIPEEKEEEKD